MKVFSHEGDGENTEHLNSMDLHDIKTELERDAEADKAEVFSVVVLQYGRHCGTIRGYYLEVIVLPCASSANANHVAK